MAEKETKVLEAEDKPKKAKKEKKKGRLKKAWNGFKSEFKKISWPSRKQVLKGSAVVLVVVAICAVVIGALDFAFQKGMLAFTDLFTDLFSKLFS